jgi:zinc protease
VSAPEADVDPRGRSSFPIEEATLDNGVRLVLQPDPDSPVAALVLCIPAGRRTERPGEEGVSHFLEHCYSLGSAKLGPRGFDRTVRELGGWKNAFTHHDYTSFHAAVPKEGLDRIIELEADRFLTLRLEPEHLESELRVVKEERLRTENVPSTRIFEKLLALAYPRHPYGRPIIGTSENLSTLSVDKVRDYFRAHYTSSNATYVIAGGFEPSAVVARFESAMGSAERREPITVLVDAEPEQTSERRAQIDGRVSDGAMLSVLYKGPGFDSEDAAALAIIGHALAGGRAALLYRRLVRERHVANNISGGWWALKDPSPISFSLRARDGVSVEELEANFLAVITELAERGLTEAELDRVRAQMHLSAWRNAESAHGRASRIARVDVTSEKRCRFGADYTIELEAMSGADIARTARKYLIPERRSVVVALPVKEPRPFLGLAPLVDRAPSQPAPEVEIQPPRSTAVPDLTAAPPLASSGSGPAVEPYGSAFRIQLANGFVLLYEQQKRLPLLTIACDVQSGSVFDFEGRHGLSALTGDLGSRGTERLDEESLAIAFADLGTALGAYRGIELTKLRTDIGTDDLANGMCLFSEVIQRPAFEPTTFERIKSQWLTGWRRGSGRAGRLLRIAGLRTAFGDHPYSWPAGGTESGISAITLDDVRAFHQSTVRPARAALGVVGDFEPALLIDVVSEHFAGWPRGEASRPGPVVEPDVPNGPRIVLIDLPDQRQAHIQMSHRLSLSHDHPDWRSIYLAESMLGGDGLDCRLPSRIRTKEGLAYAVGCFVEPNRSDGLFGMRAQTSAENCGRVIDLLLEELNRFLDEGVSDDELASTRSRSLARMVFAKESIAQRAASLTLTEMYQLGPDYGDRILRQLAEIQRPDLESTVRARIKPEALSILVVGKKDDVLPQLARYGDVRLMTAHELDIA